MGCADCLIPLKDCQGIFAWRKRTVSLESVTSIDAQAEGFRIAASEQRSATKASTAPAIAFVGSK
jgi:hypothetical protein